MGGRRMGETDEQRQVNGAGRGFRRPGGLIAPAMRRVGEKRGFAVTRLLTHWAEFVGPEIAAIARPVKISHSRGGLGATLTLLCGGAQAPVVQAQIETIRERVNIAYGYNAISRLRLTQTAPGGLAEDPAPFAPSRGPAEPQATPPARAVSAPARGEASRMTRTIHDPELRAALAVLAANVLSRAARSQAERES